MSKYKCEKCNRENAYNIKAVYCPDCNNIRLGGKPTCPNCEQLQEKLDNGRNNYQKLQQDNITLISEKEQLQEANAKLEAENECLRNKLSDAIVCPACCESMSKEDYVTVKHLGEVNKKYHQENQRLTKENNELENSLCKTAVAKAELVGENKRLQQVIKEARGIIIELNTMFLDKNRTACMCEQMNICVSKTEQWLSNNKEE